MNDKVKTAIAAMDVRRLAFMNAEKDAIVTLSVVLLRAGEQGVSICPEDCIDGEYVCVAEVEPLKFAPITRVRYWQDKLEVFVSAYAVMEGGGWEIGDRGDWIPYNDAHTDTWLMLDLVSENIEYANGYE